MTDRELLLKKLALIETCVEELRTLARPEQLSSDVREVVEKRFDDLLDFAEQIRRRLGESA